MTKTRWIIFSIICLLVLAGLVALSQRNKVSVEDVDPAKVITDGDYPDHTLGKVDSGVVLIEYGDFQCPTCQAVNQPVKQIVSEYEDDIVFVARHYPITSIHPHALAAAATVEAAGKQGKYWEMYDKIYENQSNWANLTVDQRQGYFDSYAEELGLDIDQFRADIISDEITRRIARDRALADKINITGTPTFVLNGEKLPQDLVSDLVQGSGEKFRDLLDKEIKQTGGTPPTRQ